MPAGITGPAREKTQGSRPFDPLSSVTGQMFPPSVLPRTSNGDGQRVGRNICPVSMERLNMAEMPAVNPHFDIKFLEVGRVKKYRIAPNGANPRMLSRKSIIGLFPKVQVLSPMAAREKSKGASVRAPR